MTVTILNDSKTFVNALHIQASNAPIKRYLSIGHPNIDKVRLNSPQAGLLNLCHQITLMKDSGRDSAATKKIPEQGRELAKQTLSTRRTTSNLYK